MAASRPRPVDPLGVPAFDGYGRRAGQVARYAAAHPALAVRALRALRAAPRARAELRPGGETAAVRRGLVRGSRLGRLVVGGATLVLVVPADPRDYERGGWRKAIRYLSRRAEQRGVRWSRVDDEAERARLLALADRSEREHVHAAYRSDRPDNADLPAIRTWYAAYDAAGAPLLLAVVAVSGEWALLRYFHTLGSSVDASDSRYLMSRVLVAEMAARRVRFVAVADSPLGLPDGLRLFLHKTGFTILRVRLDR